MQSQSTLHSAVSVKGTSVNGFVIKIVMITIMITKKMTGNAKISFHHVKHFSHDSLQFVMLFYPIMPLSQWFAIIAFLNLQKLTHGQLTRITTLSLLYGLQPTLKAYKKEVTIKIAVPLTWRL